MNKQVDQTPEGVTPDAINHIDSGNIAVKCFKDSQGRWRFRVSVFGTPSKKTGMRAGLTAVLIPEEHASSKALTDAFGRLAAGTAEALAKLETIKGNNACIDPTDAYKGAIEALEHCMLEMKARGIL